MQQHFGQTVRRIVSVPLPARRATWRRVIGTLLDPAPDLAYRNFQPQLAHAIRTGLVSLTSLKRPD